MTPPAWLLRAAEEITRDGAREAARDELRDPIYRSAEPSTLDRIVTAVRDWLADQFTEAFSSVVGGGPGLFVLIAVIVAVALVIRYGAGPIRGRDALTDRRRGAEALSAADYRAEAERLAAAGEHKEAVRARFRAVVRELEERGVIDVRAGRTAGEVAAEAGALVPLVATDIRLGAEIFGSVWYGGAPATAEMSAQLRSLDDTLRSARLAVHA